MVGACQTIFDTTVAYAKERHQFGVPIGSFQAVKHKLANLYVALERARATAYFAAACIAEDDPRRAVAASMAKAAAGDCQRVVAADGIQLLGGIGYTWEHDQHLFVKRVKLGEILFGSAAHHRALSPITSACDRCDMRRSQARGCASNARGAHTRRCSPGGSQPLENMSATIGSWPELNLSSEASAWR